MHWLLCCIFILLFVFKIAGLGGMATVSWWIVFAPLILLGGFWAAVVLVFVGGWHILTKR